MAASLRVSPVEPGPQKPESVLPAAPTAPAHAYLARLAALHDDAAETAYLANLLGRAPWAAGGLGAASLAVGLMAAQTASAAALTAWLALVAASVATIARAYSRTIAAPFDRPTLKDFARTLSATLLYAGTAWGAGAFLVMTPSAGFAGSFAFIAGVSGLLATILRARDVTLCFVVPATATAAFCSLMQGAGGLALLGVFAGGLLVAVPSIAMGRLAAPALRVQPG